MGQKHSLNPVPTDALLDACQAAAFAASEAHGRAFKKRRKHHTSTATVEAAVWHLLRQSGRSVDFHEDPSHGGWDFTVSGGGKEIAVEVTSITDDAMTRQTGLDPARWTEMQWYDYPLDKLCYVVGDKKRQFSGAGSSVGRVLVIGSFHMAQHVLFGKDAAKESLTGRVGVSVMLGQADSMRGSTRAKGSVFIELVDGVPRAINREVSAVVFVSCYSSGLSVVGLLNPDPIVLLDLDAFPGVLFYAAEVWPPQGGQFVFSWRHGEGSVSPGDNGHELNFDGV